jgi:hypothetical protein
MLFTATLSESTSHENAEKGYFICGTTLATFWLDVKHLGIANNIFRSWAAGLGRNLESSLPADKGEQVEKQALHGAVMLPRRAGVNFSECFTPRFQP